MTAKSDSGELEPVGCPTPGACSCAGEAAALRKLRTDDVAALWARLARIRSAANRIVNMDAYTEDIIDKMRAEARDIVRLT